MRPKAEIGTIIHATLRTEDLIPAFMAELNRLDPDQGAAAAAELLTIYRISDKQRRDEELNFFLNEQLFDALDSLAPEGCYFGAHPGDGSDFGFWPCEE